MIHIGCIFVAGDGPFKMGEIMTTEFTSNAVKFCPYCGASAIEFVKDVPRCCDCRRVFVVSYSRRYRRTAAKKGD